MRPSNLFVTLALLIALASGYFLGSLSAADGAKAASSAVPQWEYHSQDYDFQPGGGGNADSLGAQGWELVCVTNAGQNLIGFYKRPKR
jgi:hypothetical protein